MEISEEKDIIFDGVIALELVIKARKTPKESCSWMYMNEVA